MIRQVMEGASLTLWPVLSLVLFMASSAVMLAWMYRPGSRGFYDRLSRMVLREEEGKD